MVRWALWSNGEVWPRRHGMFTYADERHAREHRHLCLVCAPDDAPPDLEARAFWCWEENHYPFQQTDQL